MEKHFILSLTNGEGYSEPLLFFFDQGKEDIQLVFKSAKSNLSGGNYRVEEDTDLLFACTELDEDDRELYNFAVHQMVMKVGESLVIDTNYVNEFYNWDSEDLEEFEYMGKEVFDDHIEESYEGEDGTLYIKITII